MNWRRPLFGLHRQRPFGPADWLLAAVLLGGSAMLATHLPQLFPQPTVTGRADAIDGDSLRLDGREIRISGIDAPEYHQSCERYGQPYDCGHMARAVLAGKIARKPVACRAVDTDRYGRMVAVCWVSGENLGAALVREGIAVSYGRYEREEDEAKAARRGIWAGTFERPKDWRLRHPWNDRRGLPDEP